MRGDIKLKVEDLSISFGGVKALDGISLNVKEGEILGLIGPNGCGKSSLLNCINGFYRPDEGRIYFEGREITHLPPHTIARLGVGRTFQRIQMYTGMTVLDNLLAGRHLKMKSNPLSSFIYWPWVNREEVQHRRAVEDIIDFLEIESVRQAIVGTLGYGIRKRVDLGRALAIEPKLLLLDEPTAGMNVEEKEDMVRFIFDIRQKMKIPLVIVEHDMEILMDIADRIVALDFGHKIADGSPDQVKRNSRVIQAYLEGGKVVEEPEREEGESIEGPDTLPKFLKRNFELFCDEVAEREKDYGIWRTYTWKEVYEEVKSFSLGLISLGLKKDDKVSIIGNNEPELYWAQFGVTSAGGTAVCLYPDSLPSEVEYIFKDSDSVFAVAEDQEQADKFLSIAKSLPLLKKVIYWDPKGMWLRSDPILISFQEVQELGRKYDESHPGFFEKLIEEGKCTDIACILYTSGTTGAPKGVLWTHNNMMDNAERYLSAYGRHTRHGAQYLTYISPAWATEQVFGISLGLMKPLLVNFPEEPETVSDNIREIAPETLMLGPRQWEGLISTVQAKMLDANWLQRLVYKTFMPIGYKVARIRAEGKKIGIGLSVLGSLGEVVLFRPLRDRLGLLNLKIAATGGTGISPDIFYFFHGIGVDLRQGYGVSEAGFLTTHFDNSVKFDTVGQVYKTNPRFGPPLEVKLSAEGEVLVRGGSPFLGYYKKPEATAKKIDSEGWYHTGDAGQFIEDGHLIILDRLEDLRTLSTGHPFPPQYIEVRIRFSPFIRDVVVLGDNEKSYISAIVDIDPETVGRWAEQRRISYATFPELSQKDEVTKLIREEIAKVNSKLPSESQVKKFINLPKPFDADEGDLTRTWKLRRGFVEKRYTDIIENMYGGKKEYLAQTIVKYRDGKTRETTTEVKIIDV
jgi:long-chain acyl-CoA synthetase